MTTRRTDLRRHGLLCLLLALAMSGARASAVAPATAPAKAEPYEALVYTAADGKTLPYRLLKPENYDATKKYPLVVLFHGAGERGDDNKRQLAHGASLFTRKDVRERFPAFVIFPQCPQKEQWVDMPWGTDSGTQPKEPTPGMRMSLELIAQLQKQYSIDADRLYVTGLSMGGYATWDAITRYPDLFAAAVPICGGGDAATAARAAKVPVWAFHSADDNVVKVKRTRDMIEGMRAAGGAPRYSEYTKLGHGSWGKAYGEADLLPWLFAQRRGQKMVEPPAGAPAK